MHWATSTISQKPSVTPENRSVTNASESMAILCRMTLLPSFSPACNVAVVGASGGIGQAVLRLLSDDSRVANKHAFARSPIDASLLKIMDQLCPEDSGGVFAWDGSRIQY